MFSRGGIVYKWCYFVSSVVKFFGRFGNYWYYEWCKFGCCVFVIVNFIMGYSVFILFVVFGMFYWCVVIYIYYLLFSKKIVGFFYGCYFSGYCYFYF